MEDSKQSMQQIQQKPVNQSPELPSPVTHFTPNQRRTNIIVLLLVFVYPLGLILMLTLTKWPKRVKLLISVPLILFILLAIFFFIKVAFLPSPFQQ
jgi:4-amino-4-deoxy-L-arabinose transferase-like glycosyltransferase